MAKTKNKKTWRDAFGPDEIVQRIRPEYTDKYLNNPHKGTTTFQRFNGDPIYPDLDWNDREGPLWFKAPKKSLKNGRYPDTSMSYCRWAWEDLEPIRGEIRFEVIEGALKAAALRGQTLQIRTQPHVGGNGPKWLYDLGVKTRPNQKYGRILRDNDPIYLKEWSRHIKALGKKFDGHPALESIDIALAGACGETGGELTKKNALFLFDAYTKAFKKTQLVSLGNTMTGNVIKDYPKQKIGWRKDCYGDVSGDLKKFGGVPDHLCWNHMYDYYPEKLHELELVDQWKHGPVTLETCWTVAFWDKMKWDIDWIIEHGYKYHLSVFMPKSVYIPEKWADKINEFNKKMGYRFFLHQMMTPLEAKAGEKFEVKTNIDNKGVAPIYRDYKFALKFTQGKKSYIVPFKADIRKWLPDYNFFKEKMVMPKQLKKGEVKISCGIINDENKAVVKLAIKAIDKDNWHPLTSMNII